MTSPAQQWQEMKDEAKVEWLAVKVMGWKRINGHASPCCYAGFSFAGVNNYGDIKCELCGKVSEKACVPWVRNWNPLTDWNHWRQVELQIMKDEELAVKVWDIVTEGKAFGGWLLWMQSSLGDRCQALFIAYHANQ